MAEAINLNSNDFPEVIKLLNNLADKISLSPDTKPSVRKLAAELILEAGNKRIKELTGPSNGNNSSVEESNNINTAGNGQ